MPELNAELPQVEAQGGIGAVSPNLEAVSAPLEEGVEKLGGQMEQTSDVFYRRQSQQEVSQVYADMAQARETWNDNLQDAARTRDIDPDEFKQKMSDAIQPIGDNLSTAAGQKLL